MVRLARRLSGFRPTSRSMGRETSTWADYEANRVRRISPDGIITTVAGDGVARFAGDGGPATIASLQAPICVAAARDGTLYIADSANNSVRKVT
jgi:hypothetical protein